MIRKLFLNKRKQIAVVSCSFRFPGSDTKSFWPELLAGRDFITQVDASRWEHDEFLHPDKANPATSYTFASGTLGDIRGFDAAFFNISPREAAIMDPQQRMLLEMGWETFENAGIRPSGMRGSDCGVFLGIAGVEQAYRLVEDLASIDAATATGNTMSIAANRLSFFYDLRGPSMAIDTACSSSLVAFHQACQAIASGEISQALTGGISLHMHPFGFMIFSKASMLSRAGRCQAFDAAGDGYARSEGGGLFLLKDYDQALADGNPILAVVAGSAVNTDGRKSSLTLPSADSQATLLGHVYAQAGIDPAQLDYLEAHGTGTAVGDPIETRAIGQALAQGRGPGNPLPIGSIKSNLGHLEAASGVAGLVKALHCLRERQVPATIGIRELNPNIPFADLNLDVVCENRPLKREGQLTIGVNSFGFGGANAHVILLSPEPVGAANEEVGPEPAQVPLLLSAKDEQGLRETARRLQQHLTANPDISLYDVAYQYLFRRDLHPQRLAILGRDRNEFLAALGDFADAEDAGEPATTLACGRALDEPSGPVFVYSGNGCQWFGMGRALLGHPGFAATLAEVDALFQPLAGFSLRAELAGENGEGRYVQTEIAQPALFAVQVGVTRMLRDLGVEPVAVVGHSVGEVAAAWACGALSLADATAVIYHRSRLQGLTRGTGQMTAVGLGGEATAELLAELGLDDSLCVASENSSRGATVAGPVESLAHFEAVLDERQVFARRLDLDYAFHSPAMNMIEQAVISDLAHIQPRSARIPFYSTVVGGELDGARLDSQYWWQNIRCPVMFQGALGALAGQAFNLFVEVGAHPILRSYVADALKEHGLTGQVVATLQRGDESPRQVELALARLLVGGFQPDWQRYFPVEGRFVGLPNYAWQHEVFDLPVSAETLGMLQRKRVHPLLGYPLPDREATWENRLDTQLFPTLADHKVGESVLFPGAAFLELAMAAALELHPGDFVDIEELEIHSPLLLPAEGSKKVRLGIETADGTLRISSRGLGVQEEWAQHVVARLPGEARGVLLGGQAPDLPERAPDYDGARHLALTRAVGLHYGPAYQTVEAAWVTETKVLALLRAPAEISQELEQLHLHPALLDGAFQLITELLVSQPVRNRGLAFIPVKLGRVAFDRQGGTPRIAEVRPRKRSEHSLLVDFALYDEAGKMLLYIQEARFRGVRLQRDRSSDIRHLAHHGIAAPGRMPQKLRETVPAPALAERMQEGAGDLAQLRYRDEVEPLLDALCSSFVLDLLESLPQGHLSFEQYEHWAGQVPPAFLQALLRQAEADGSLAPDGENGWRLVESGERPSSQAIWQELFRSYPEQFQIIHTVGRIGSNLHALLEGQQPLDALLPRESSPAALARQILGSDGAQRLSAGLRTTLAQHLDSLPAGQRLRVLEMGLGEQPLFKELYGALDFDRLDYLYCPGDAEHGEQLRGEYPNIQVLAAEGIECIASVDWVLLPDDFAPLGTLSQALQQASSRLAPHGQLLMQAHYPSRWADFVFGAAADWWLPGTEQALSRQQRPAFWQEELERLGLPLEQMVEALPGSACGSYWLLARSGNQTLPAATPATACWALLADGKDPAAQVLSELLRERGQQVAVLAPGDAQALANQLAALDWAPDHLLHLAGLDDGSGLDGQGARCLLAAAAVQACEAVGISAQCWLLTRGAASHLSGDAEPQALDAIADSAFWGFGRTLANESATCRIRLVDLAPDTPLPALVPVLLCADEETEIALDAAGRRHAPRLRILEQAPSASQSDSRVCLGFELPGQLRNLRWEIRETGTPAADELEVQVRATGLNFRDVMFALGLLSDEAIENGFSGPTLGFEFAGEVSAVGSAVMGTFAPGERVVGFGPSSFANRLTTSANAVARIPEGMSFEAAATIPSTFFTVFYALHHLARLEPGEKVLIHGAAGGVGLAAIQVARWCGAEIYATAGSDEKRGLLRMLGVQHIFDSRSLAYADEVLAATGGQGVDVVLNSLAGEAINRNFRVLRPFGRFLELGKRDFYQNTRIGLRPFRNNISYFGIDADQLMSERPELTRRLFGQMMELFEQGVLHPLPFREFDANQVVEAFRYMQQARQIGKIVITYRTPFERLHDVRQQPHEALHLDAQATYLVTGGLGGFGLRTAQWLVEKGARHLVLLGRRGPASEEAQPLLATWKAAGIDARAEACDVTDPAQLRAQFERIAASPWPLRGVVHAATVIDDGLIRNLDAGQLQRVLEPKAKGAQYLHELSAGLALDFFVLFSSATTLFGNPGQANYVAANHWLEGLARYRRSLGLPATAVLWGAIDDAGFLARNEQIKAALQSRMGGSALRTELALAHLEQLLLRGDSGLGVLELEWKALARFLPSAGTPRFSELARLHGGEQDDESAAQDIRQMLEELDEPELLERFVELLKLEVSEILRLPASRVDAQRPLQELGLDSLMSVELVVALEDRFGIRLPVMELSETSSLDKLSVRLLELLRGEHAPAEGSEVLAGSVLARHGVQFSTEEIQEMSKQLEAGTAPKPLIE